MSVGITREEYELEREQFQRALDCIEAMARGDAESTYAGLQCAERFRIKNPSESAWVDGHWLEFVPPEYRDLVEDKQ